MHYMSLTESFILIFQQWTSGVVGTSRTGTITSTESIGGDKYAKIFDIFSLPVVPVLKKMVVRPNKKIHVFIE